MNCQLRQQNNRQWIEETIDWGGVMKQRAKHRQTSNLPRNRQQRGKWQRTQSWAETFELSAHARRRAGQRGLRQADICYVLCHGKRTFAADATIYFLRAIDIPRQDQATRGRLEGTAVLVSQDQNAIITVWRNRLHGTRNLNRKEDQHWYTLHGIK